MRRFAVTSLLVGMGLGLVIGAAHAGEAGDAARGYLLQAQQAVRAHDAGAAMVALGQAEGAWLTATEARPNPVVHHGLASVQAIGMARASVQTQHWNQAEISIDAALHQMGAGDFTG